jgi:general secretion pathway protein D
MRAAKSHASRDAGRVLVLWLALASLIVWALPGCAGPDERRPRRARPRSERAAEQRSARDSSERFSDIDVLSGGTRQDSESLEPLAADGAGTGDGLLLAQAAPDDGEKRRPRRGGGNRLDDVRERESLKLFEAEFEADLGDRAFEEADYPKARDHYERALALNPALDRVRDRLHNVKVLLDERAGQAGSVATDLFDQGKVRAQQVYEDSRRGIQEAQELMKEGNLTQARGNLRKIRDQLEYNRDYPGDVTKMRSDVKKLLETVAKLEKDQKRQINREQQEMVREVRGRELRTQERQRQRQVRQLLGKAFDYIRFKEYEKVIDSCKRILRLDPKHHLAKFLLKDARRQILDVQRTELLKLDYETRQQNQENLEISGIPWQDPFVFPDEDDWKIAKGRKKSLEVVLEDDPEPVRRIKAALNDSNLTFRFEETPLLEVVAFLRGAVGININVDPSIDTEMTIDLDVDKMRASDALKLVLEQTGLGQTYREQVLYITEREKARGSLIFQIYNVADILNKIRDFSGPTLALKSTDDDEETGSGVSIESNEELDDTQLEPEDLIDLIKDSTGGEVVWGELNSIEFDQGLLFVNSPRELHVEIQDVLNNLRKDSDIFVMIEARFIDVTDDFLEDIGIDYRGLGAVNNLGTPFGQILNLPGSAGTGGNQRVRNDLGFVRQGSPINDVTLIKGQDRWAGRVQHIVDGFAGTISGERLGGGAQGLGGLTLQGTWLDPFQVNAIVRAVQEKSDVRQLTAPTVTAHNGQRVYVSVITQRAYIADYELVSGGTGFQIIEVADPVVATFQEGVILDVDPVISPDKKFVTLDVRPTMATLIGGVISTILISLGSFTNVAFEVPIGVPRVALQQSFTSVTVPNGGTVLLGGFKSIAEQKFTSSMPMLQHVPLLKNLFRRKADLSERQSLVILLTAKIINPRSEESAQFNDA